MASSEEAWAQEVITCDCCDKPTQQFCNSCQVSLCEGCVKKHRVEFQSLSHEIVHFLDRKIQLAFPECQEHPGHRCEAHCQQCLMAVCIKCLLGTHKGHDAEELIKFHERRIQEIEKETQEFKVQIFPCYKKEDSDIEITMSKIKSKFKDLGKENRKQRELWHREVDNIFDKIDSLSQSFRNKNLDAFQTYQTEIRNLISEMTKTIQQNNKILKSKKILEVYSYQPNLKKYEGIFDKINLDIPSLSKTIHEGEKLSIGLGDFRATLTQVSNSCLANLLDEVEVIADVPTDYRYLYSVACVGEAEAWISGSDKNITRIDIHGSVKDTVSAIGQYGPSDISVSKEGELMYCDYLQLSGKVKIVKHGKTEPQLTTPLNLVLLPGIIPQSLRSTKSGDILIHVKENITQRGGEKKHKIIRYQGKRRQEDIYHSFMDEYGTLFMTENNNEDVCISDTKAEIVVVLNKRGNDRFRYDGKPASRKESFNPGSIVTDSLSQIIVTDNANNCLHIIDQNGHFLRCVHDNGLEKPWGLSVDSKGRLWVGLRDSGKLKVMKYLKQN